MDGLKDEEEMGWEIFFHQIMCSAYFSNFDDNDRKIEQPLHRHSPLRLA
jgi:hypothetical protein